jgi:hypothetical protein
MLRWDIEKEARLLKNSASFCPFQENMAKFYFGLCGGTFGHSETGQIRLGGGGGGDWQLSPLQILW